MAINICCHCLTFLKTVTGIPRPVAFMAKHLAAQSKHGDSVQELACGIKPRYMATSVRTDEEKKLRMASREEKMAAHQKFPFLPTKSTRQVYILDKTLAVEIARVVRKNQIDPSVPILEANPGPGVLTKALLKAGVKRIVTAEALKHFIPYLEDLQEQYGSRVLTVYNWDYLALWRRLTESNCMYKEHEDKLAAVLPHRDWADGPPLTVVGVIPDLKERTFLSQLLMSCSRQYGLFMLGRPEWFLAVSPNMYKHLLVAKMEENRPGVFYSRLAVVLHLVFDIRLCAELPGWKFTPPFPEKRKKFKDHLGPVVNNSTRYLLHMRPHGEQTLPLSEILAFLSFLNQVMKRKKQRLIPKMEQLVPGCGIHLIMLGFSMMQAIVDVSPAEFVNIFKAMQTWPEYEGSPMKQHLTESTFSTIDDENVEDAQKQD